MSYSIQIESGLRLSVCVGEYDSFEEAKCEMANLIRDLIGNQQDRFYDGWENFIEDFPDEIQDLLTSYKLCGEANFEDDVYEDDGEIMYSANDTEIEISGKPDVLGYHIRIETNAVNMEDEDENYSFTLTRAYDGGEDCMTIKLLVDDGAVAVYDIIPDDVRSRLEPVDLEDDDD